MYLIGLDLGTTGCKSMVFDTTGQILGEHYIEYEVIFLPDGGAEQDAELWWQYAAEAVAAAVKKAGIDPKEAAGISVSSQGCAFVPVGRDGKPLSNAISWYDTRALPQVRALYAHYGEKELFYRLGHPAESLVFPEILRLKEETPELYQKTWKFLMPHDYLICRMTGRAVTDPSMASGSMCYDVLAGTWARDLLQAYDIDEEKLPEICEAGTVAGALLQEAAEQMGLCCDTVVAVGMQDQKIAALGAGIQTGSITVSLGTASAVETLCTAPQRDAQMQVQCHGFCRGMWALENSVDTAGAALKWARRTFCADLSYREMDALAARAAPGANGVCFYPLLCRGTTNRNQGCFDGLGLETSRADLIRAVLEGVACAIRACAERQKALNPDVQTANRLTLYGGGSGSPLWCQIIADITGMEVALSATQETGNLGAAICAGVGTGIFPTLWAGQKAMCGEVRSVYLPDETHRAACEMQYKRYLKLKEEAQ